MKAKTLIFYSIIFLFFVSFAHSYENLTELEARTSRKSINTFYSGATLGNSYRFQPQTVIYYDTTTGKEVWVWSQTANRGTMGPRWSGTEYGVQPWSADGKRIAFSQNNTPGCFTPSYGYAWFTSRSDGSYIRPLCESVNRTDDARKYPDWSPIYPDVMYTVGYNSSGVSGKDQNAIYREVVTDTSIASTLIVDLIPGNTSTLRQGANKSATSGDGLYMIQSMFAENEPFYFARIEPEGSRGLTLTYNQPSLDAYWCNTPSSGQGNWHDEWFTGNASMGYWVYFLHSGINDTWRMRPWGTDSGAPNHTTDHTAPYDWWSGTDAQKEIQIVGCQSGNRPTVIPPLSQHLWAHQLGDRWGNRVAYCESGDDNPGNYGPAAYDVGGQDRTGYNSVPGCQYPTWNGWTDYFATVTNTSSGPWVWANKYNSTTSSDHIRIANLHSTSVSGDVQSPGQSPDGTKIWSRSDWLNPSKGESGVYDGFVSIPYYPYPPEITSVTASGGTVMVRFDWRHNQTTKRTYTTRGWPNETTDNAPPPREIEKYRLWRSTDKITWTPIGTVNHDIFIRYDFSTGTWSGNSYWEITNAPGNGTWYYAVTSVEWSGLESRSLSNIYAITVSGGSGTGSQDTTYPASPGGKSNFYNSYSSRYTSLLRYYNVYALDGSAPTTIQQRRIASIPKNHCSTGSCSWVDWLGNIAGTTQYIVTPVDSQGNEGSPISITVTHQKSPATAPGQYTLEWSGSGDLLPNPPTNLSIQQP